MKWIFNPTELVLRQLAAVNNNISVWHLNKCISLSLLYIWKASHFKMVSRLKKFDHKLSFKPKGAVDPLRCRKAEKKRFTAHRIFFLLILTFLSALPLLFKCIGAWKKRIRKKKVWNNNFFHHQQKVLGSSRLEIELGAAWFIFGIHTEFQIIALFFPPLCQVGCQDWRNPWWNV